MLLAAAVDEMRETQWMMLRRWGQKNTKRPDPIQRPGVTPIADHDTVGANDGFDSWGDMAEWYAALELTPSDPSTTPKPSQPRGPDGRFIKRSV